VGVTPSAFWASWGTVGYLLAFFLSNLQIIASLIFRQDVFVNTPFL